MENHTTPTSLEPSPASPKTGLAGSLKRPGNLSLALIFMTMLIDVMGISLLWPVAAYIVQEYSGQAIAVTMLTVIYAAAQFLAAPALGKLSDRYGRRPVLLVCLAGAMVSYLIFGMAGALWVLFASRLLGGITGGSLSTASAYIADVSRPEELTKNFGLIGLAWGVGMVIGPALGGALGQFGLRLPAFAAAVLCFINLALGLFLLPESLPKERRSTQPLRMQDFNSLASIGAIAAITGVAGMLVVQSLFNLGFNGLVSTESLFFIEKFAAQPWQIGLQTVLVGITLALVQALLVQRVTRRFGDAPVSITAVSLMAVTGVLTCLVPQLWMIYPVTAFRAAASALFWPTITALLVRHVPQQQMGVLMGVTAALNSLTGIFSPILAGILYDQVHPAAPYWMAAIFFAAAAGTLFFLTRGAREIN